jgi:hypothetical protein
MQKVIEGKTESGMRGLFTNGTYASRLPKYWDELTHEQRVAHCAGRGFELMGGV